MKRIRPMQPETTTEYQENPSTFQADEFINAVNLTPDTPKFKSND
jgi:hypothetical protein